MKRIASILAGLSILSAAPTVFAASPTHSQQSAGTKTVSLNGNTLSTPKTVVYHGTSYMPIWYLIQALNKIGISNKWNGTKWSLSTPSSMSLQTNHIDPGTGRASIVINNRLVKRVDAITTTDAASGKDTTYMPIWYLMQILTSLDLRAAWNGQTLQITTPAYVSQLRKNVVKDAKKYIGVAYEYGGESIHGFDCSGFVQHTFRLLHIPLPRVAAEQAKIGVTVKKSSLKPGDLVFFNTLGSLYSHVGIYVGKNQFISATTSHGVTISQLNNPFYWGHRFTRATNPFVEG